MSKNPNVSVVIPTYNRAHLIGRAIKSVLDQTYQDFEIIVVDDDSTDNTEEVVKRFNDSRIHYIRHKQNRGGAVARNTGIKAARGKYIAFQDSDDEWLPEKLEKQINCFVKYSDSIGAVYCLYYTQDDSLGYMRKASSCDMRCGNVYNFLLNAWCPSITSSIILAVRIFEKTGMFDENLPSFQDYDLWIRVAQHYNFEFIDEPLVVVHKHSGSQVARDLEPRMKGLKLFLDKWGNAIKKEAGKQAFNDIRRKHLFAIYQNAVFDNLAVSQRSEAMKYLKRLWEIKSLSLTVLVKVMIVLLGGTRLLNFSKLVWIKISQIIYNC